MQPVLTNRIRNVILFGLKHNVLKQQTCPKLTTHLRSTRGQDSDSTSELKVGPLPRGTEGHPLSVVLESVDRPHVAFT